MKPFTTLATILFSLVLSINAQTWSDCNPMNATDCKPNTALGVANYTIDYTKSMMTDTVWNFTAGKVNYVDDGGEFTVAQRGDTPTVRSRFYIFWGQLEVIMKAAPGQGIVSSIVMQSDDLDEVDWEMIGGNDTHVQTNYFGKGNTTSYDRAAWHPVDQVQGQWHNYTVDWSKEKLDWYIDGKIIRTLKYEEANGGHNFPQTPCDIRLGIWAGGDKKNNNYTIEWAGGETDYDAGPYTMLVKSVRVSDASRGTQYEYGDQTGSFESIKVLNETDPIKLDGSNKQTVAQQWRALSTGAKIGIGCAIGGVLAIGIIVFAICCMKQRRLGKHERLLEDAKFEKDRAELLAYRAEMGRQRNEKIAMIHHKRAISPVETVGASIMPSTGNPKSHDYAGSLGSYNSGRGYQRY